VEVEFIGIVVAFSLYSDYAAWNEATTQRWSGSWIVAEWWIVRDNRNPAHASFPARSIRLMVCECVSVEYLCEKV
jgi:hypothetical protein